MGVINDLGILAIASRLERLSENLKWDAAEIYKKHHDGIKYKWYTVLYVIYKKPGIGVVELAEELSYAHPSVIQLIREVEENKLVRSRTDKADKRKRCLELTAKGSEMIKEMLPYSAAFKRALNELTKGDHDLMQALEDFEQKLEDSSFFKRVEKELQKTGKAKRLLV
jgi:DNA-binding MarR family transcriptional regulator